MSELKMTDKERYCYDKAFKYMVGLYPDDENRINNPRQASKSLLRDVRAVLLGNDVSGRTLHAAWCRRKVKARQHSGHSSCTSWRLLPDSEKQAFTGFVKAVREAAAYFDRHGDKIVAAQQAVMILSIPKVRLDQLKDKAIKLICQCFWSGNRGRPIAIGHETADLFRDIAHEVETLKRDLSGSL